MIAAFRHGKIDLPPMAVDVPLKDRTLQAQTPAGLSFDVRSVMPANEKEPQPKPPAARAPLPLGAAFWWTFAGMARSLPRSPVAAPAPEPAAAGHGRAESGRRCRRSRAAGALDAPARPSRRCSRLHTQLEPRAAALPGRTFALPALESTTSEIQRVLSSNLGRRLPSPLVRQTVELLRGCDLVKFARQEVGETRGRERVAAARQLGRDLEQIRAGRRAPAEAPETAG